MRHLLATCVILIGSLSACEPLPSITVADLLRAGNPVPLIEAMMKLGHTIDLSSTRQVSAAIGDVKDAQLVRSGRARRDGGPVFAGYTLTNGEIVYNPLGADVFYLGVSMTSCAPIQAIRERLHAPEFMQSASRTDILLDTRTFYADRPLTAFTYTEVSPGCADSFGLMQWTHDPRRSL